MRLPGCPTPITSEDINRLERLIATDWTANADWIVQWGGVISTTARLPYDSSEEEIRRAVAMVEQVPSETFEECTARAQLIVETHTYLPTLLAEIKAWRALATETEVNKAA
jgi:hypothetical protein